eukprot:5878288-Prymnesium_polylepis.1
MNEASAGELLALLRGWFLTADGSRSSSQLELRRDDVTTFVSWTMFNAPFSELLSAQRRRVDALLDRMEEELLGRPLAAGATPGLRPMTYTLEPLAPAWKPLLFYLVLQSAHRALGLLLRAAD